MHYPDEQAIANAKRGYQAHLAEERLKGTPPPVAHPKRPSIVRVNSVPVLGASADPITPQDRVRRQGSGQPVGPKISEATGRGSEPEACGTQPSQPMPTQSEWQGEGGASESMAKTLQEGGQPCPAPRPDNAAPDGARPTGGRRAAAKSKPEGAVPPTGQNPHINTTGSAETPQPRSQPACQQHAIADAAAGASKAEPDPEQERQQAARANIRRADTTMQTTPAPEPEGDIEEELEREMKKEDLSQHDKGALAEATVPVQSTETEPGKCIKKRRPKTEIEKAAHARYTRFSRSFERILTHTRVPFLWRECTIISTPYFYYHQ